ncbi:DUF2938 family protein [Marinobacterium rhizophilum]|uniref:DUF2938 family protein n=1 Tax=Marinobacterium rhizophilum TaxID=420402 RepID=A0ABY5HKJ9_9GAMM|nr:DUF2938 family protein [Marinobacterium rhizophilum]UTW12820.1 DUF2938 family protein [Marinobacterium rhizophilum]
MDDLIKIMMLGVFATVLIDVWSVFSNKILQLPKANWGMVGRWLGHIPKGKLIHNPIGASSAIKYESVLGWAFHYLVGIAYAYIYVVLVVRYLDAPSLLAAWAFGMVTILAAWLIIQPGLGAGICAIRAPRPGMARIQNVAIHTIFGVALYYGWLWVNVLFPETA